jgi:hypothetical protein
MSRERPLPTAVAVQHRRRRATGEIDEVMLELRLCKWWRWRRRKMLREQLEYLEGLAEGLRLGGSPRNDSKNGPVS